MKTWEENAIAGMRAFQSGQQSLLEVDHDSAKRHFGESAELFLTAAKSSVKGHMSELLLNAAISHYHQAEWKKVLLVLDSVSLVLLSNDLRQTVLELKRGAENRTDKEFWNRLYRDYRTAMSKKEYDAVLDMLRTDPYLLEEDDHRQVLLHVLEKKGLSDLASDLKRQFHGPKEVVLRRGTTHQMYGVPVDFA